ncbi:hypothetical protein ACPC0Q_25060 [Bacillus bombysepticus]
MIVGTGTSGIGKSTFITIITGLIELPQTFSKSCLSVIFVT